MEAEWMGSRATSRWLVRHHPDLTMPNWPPRMVGYNTRLPAEQSQYLTRSLRFSTGARLSTVATLDNRAQFYSGKEIRAKTDHSARLQKRLELQGHSQCHPAQHRAGPGRRDGSR